MTHPRILVIGEALIDIVEGHEIVGGSPANVALGLGRLGHPVDFLTALGRDERGSRIAAHLADAGVTVLPESFTLEATSVARATLQPDGSAEYEFDIAWQLPEFDPSGYDLLHVGSIACFLEPGASALVTIVEAASAAGTRITFDPNIRPALLGGVDACARVAGLVRNASLVKVSDEDAAVVYPERSLAEVVAQLLVAGADVVAVTRGSEGARISTAQTTHMFPARAQTVVDTVGAGDSFMAALIAQLSELPDWQLDAPTIERIGNFASVAAALTVSKSGADLPTRAAVELWADEAD